jgi:hypothetical protein
MLAVSLGPDALAGEALAAALLAAGFAAGLATAFLAGLAGAVAPDFSPRAAASISSTDIAPGFFWGSAAGLAALEAGGLAAGAVASPVFSPRAAANISSTDIAPAFLTGAGGLAGAGSDGAASESDEVASGSGCWPEPSAARAAASISSIDILSFFAMSVQRRKVLRTRQLR